MPVSTKCLKKTNELTLKRKIEVIQYLQKPNSSERKASEIFNVSKTTVNNIKKRKDELLERNNTENNSKQRKRKNIGHENINKATLTWFQKMRSINARISGSMIQEVALEFASKFGNLSFKASNGWLEKFKLRHEISQRILVGDSNDVPEETVESFKEKFKYFAEGFEDKDIFNADECGLFFKAMPKYSLIQKGDTCKSGKQSKERLTVLFATSMTGEKLAPLVIGKSLNPRCFKTINKNKLPVAWRANKKAWINSTLYIEWLTNLNAIMKNKKRHILLVVDNCPAHPIVPDLSNVTVKHLPPNTTSRLQPLDQGIIKTFKSHYRKYLLKSILIESTEKDISEVAKGINVLDAVKWIDLSWKTLSKETISKCFHKAGFNLNVVSDINDISNELIDQELKSLCESEKFPISKWNDFISFDDDLAICQEIGLEEVVDCVYDEMRNEVNGLVSEDEERKEPVHIMEENITASVAKDMIKKVSNFLINLCPEMVCKTIEVENYLNDYILSSTAKALKQSKIDMFFEIADK